MTVKQLIKKLKEYPDDAKVSCTVYYPYSDNGPAYGDEVESIADVVIDNQRWIDLRAPASEDYY